MNLSCVKVLYLRIFFCDGVELVFLTGLLSRDYVIRHDLFLFIMRDSFGCSPSVHGRPTRKQLVVQDFTRRAVNYCGIVRNFVRVAIVSLTYRFFRVPVAFGMLACFKRELEMVLLFSTVDGCLAGIRRFYCAENRIECVCGKFFGLFC